MPTPVEGELYRHFKGGLYRIVTIAQHTETQEGLVIYRSEDDPSKVWARPVTLFCSPVDRVKYPDAAQEMRFEKVTGDGKAVSSSAPAPAAAKASADGDGLDPEVEAFLDAKSSIDRIHILSSLNHRLTDEMLITMATACDVELPEGDIRTKYQSLRESLVILGKYEGERLRK
ncbi:MAG: DUF1653 domain-containing protein [Lachnospiraceae bacterium]|jgi:hypothetical protein|nr:DUF1653 domain-containing protein [Lachnospiraceae bacterium]MBP5253437.1 DUF1653 domain-containing protein [Lachnospiraceae bacterium]MBP5701799.1 DUF1653 domain-containing protein [Lachnospiraceae bacterium]MBP5762723.1 DUF1653 domain-containing protein [Lachnospiraceae bacterium]